MKHQSTTDESKETTMTQPTGQVPPQLWNRRNFLGVAAVGLTLPWLAGCSDSGGGATAAPTTGKWKAMTWEGKDEVKKWNFHLGNFFKRYPDMKWQVDFGVEWETYWTKLQTLIAGGAPLDMAWMHDTRSALFASQGLLEPLDDYLSKDIPDGWPDAFYQSQVESFKYQGKQYGFPYDFATGGFFVNLDWFKKAGVDVPDESWSYDDLLEAGKRLTAAGDGSGSQWGMTLPTDSSNSYTIVKAFGGEFVTGDPLEAHFSDAGTIAAYQYLYDAMWKHKVIPNPQQVAGSVPGNTDVTPFFTGGKVAMMYSLNDVAFVMDDLIKGKFRWTVAPTPKGKSGRFQYVGGSAWSIPKGSPHPDVTYQAMKYTLSDRKNLPQTGKMGSMFVSRRDFWKYGVPPQDQVDPQAFKHTFYDLGKRDASHPNYFPNYGRWDSSVYTKNMDNLWTNTESDAAKVLAQVQTETQPLLQS
jgi:ABC-type sugar transport system, periplasmic component